MTINKANQEMAIQKHQNEELLFAQEKLRKNELELEQHNEILDNKVNHRTEELQKLNNTLVAANVKLEQSEKEIKKLSQAINQSSASIIITDLEGKIEYSNPSFTEITGYTSDDAKNSNPRLLKSGFTTKEEYDKLWNTISEGKTWKGEFLNVKKNKETFWEKAIITPVLNKSNEIINYIAIKDDITEQKKIELEILNQKQELQKLNATKDKFFSIIAHDLRSPFSAIVGYLDILLKNSRTYDDQKREQMIKLITDSAKNTFNLLENLLTWARSQYDGIEFSPKKVNLKVLLVEIIDSLMAQANKKEIKFYNAIKDDEVVFADENMLSTILRNLISNSIKFTPRGGMITLWTGKQVNDKFVKIFVMDTGIGIPKNKIDDLFQIDRSTIAQGTENEMGTGLGLLLCKEFVEKHGGKIGVESEEGEGSKFIFTLPVTD